ncbi:MAG: glycosyl hydrolase family 43 [Leptospiraceae bacterium]|nr:glycosyl hydrolase family 43 [Leptospiraceae bacterium]
MPGHRLPLTVHGFLRLRWRFLSEAPLIYPPRLSPIIADPSIVLPEEAADGQWHAFAHSVFGLHHFTASQPDQWPRRSKLIRRHAMRPFIFRDAGRFYLYYERYRPFQILFSWLTAWRWKSHIEVMSSDDLVNWTRPQIVLAPDLAYQRDRRYGQSVSNPCCLKTTSGFRLYFSASLRKIADCGFCEPLHIGAADGPTPLGPFTVRPQPLISPGPQYAYMNLAAGAIKVIHLRDGYIGLQNGISIHDGCSTSAVYAVPSRDGLNFDVANAQLLIAPAKNKPWMVSHVYAVDCRYNSREKRWYLFFNGRNTAHWTKGKEAIGCLVSE